MISEAAISRLYDNLLYEAKNAGINLYVQGDKFCIKVYGYIWTFSHIDEINAFIIGFKSHEYKKEGI